MNNFTNKTLPNLSSLKTKTLLKRIENPPNGVPRYLIDNEAYFSVTQILDDGKYDKIDQRSLMHSQVLGSIVHLQIENYLKNQNLHHNLSESLDEDQLQLYNFLPDVSDDDWKLYLQSVKDPDNFLEEIVLKRRIESSYNQFLQFIADHKIEVVLSEEVIWNPDYLYAGTVDLLCYFDGELAIIDHKTSRFINNSEKSLDSYTGQLSAYSQAIKTLENKEMNITLNLLHLDPVSSSYKLIKREFNFNVFLKALVRFSQSKILPEEKGTQNNYDEKELEKYFIDKSYQCPDKTCKENSIFPFPIEKKVLINNSVQRIIKVAFHEKNNHFAVYHIKIDNFSIERSFISKYAD